MSFADYSTTPSNNTTLAGLSVTEGGTTMASINNMIRQLMADGKELANTVASISAPLPITGGTLQGDLDRQGRGDFLHWNPTGQTSGRVFIQASGGAAPAMSNGDWLLEY